jgi:hypothetical protein
MKYSHTQALRNLIDRYSEANENATLKSLIDDINHGEYKERIDFRHALNDILAPYHKGRLGAPLMSQVNKPVITTYTHPLTDDIEIGGGKRISIRELVRQSRYPKGVDIKRIPGWNRMKVKEKIKAINEADIPVDIKADLIAPLLKDI